MSDLFVSTIFVFAVYCAWACAVYQPKHPAATVDSEAQPIDYFPEVEEEEETPDWGKEAIAVAVDFKPVFVTERRPVAAFVTPKAPAVDYSAMSIRQLKSECQKLTGTDRAVAKYSRLNRQQLIAALTR